MMCHEVAANISRFFEETLSEHENLLFQQHLEGCERCRQMCFIARKNKQVQGRWLQVTAILNILIVILAIVYFAFGPAIMASVKSFLRSLEGKALLSESAQTDRLQNGSTSKLQASVQLKPLHWDLYFPDRSKLDSLGAHLRSKGMKLLYEDSGLIILNISQESVELLVSSLAGAGGTFQGGGSVYSFKLPSFDGHFRISINLRFPQSRISQPLAHHWHLKFQLPNRFMAKDAIREAGARFLFETPEIWVVQIPGRDFNQLKEVLRSTHGVEVDFGPETVSVDAYGKIPVTISLYIAEG